MLTNENTGMSDTGKSTPSPALPNSGDSPAPPAYSRTHDMPNTILLLPQVPLLRRESALKRFLKAFFVAIGLYLVLVLVFRSLAMITFVDYMGPPAGPRTADGEIVSCFPQEAQSDIHSPNTLSYTIPTSSNLIYFLSRGSYGHGSLRFELSDHAGDDIEVDIRIEYLSRRILEHTRVCLLKRSDGGRGVGFFTPNYSRLPTSRNLIIFDTTIRFPRSGSLNSPLVIKELETKMGTWKHSIDSLDSLVSFESLSFAASNAAIEVDSVSASKAKLVTSNSPIEGFFNVSDHLILKTSNAHIESTIRMENADGYKPTRVELRTSNAYIEAPITLVSTKTHTNSRSAFSVSASTSNSRLEISFPEAPTSLPFAKLDIVAKTSNSPIEVALHPTFEGSISQRSSLRIPTLIEHGDTKDPSGGNRVRSVSRQYLGHILTSRVWWGDDNKEDVGKVEVRTSNSPNTVRLG